MRTKTDTIKAIQTLLGETPDGDFGPLCRAALQTLLSSPPDSPWPAVAQGSGSSGRTGWATSFADPDDVRAFKDCKAEGKTDEQCFAVGDNGIGFTGLDCTDESQPYVAVPWEDWHDRFGSATAAAGQPVLVTINGVEQQCAIGDTMPKLAHISNGAVLDMAPGARKLWDLAAPLKMQCSWRWPS